ncbi:hypothetical protein GLOIN_2v1483424 [Rhizophagus clarus]|uniref:Uncharacterized protein n=1 Tax=Rhizophagus clarus TaxID=94130 RepID=A0A8H3KUG7_9GLOM|nr:hypothetical protein GLOIN_2v1483424 [Rhizophagus clarus]
MLLFFVVLADPLPNPSQINIAAKISKDLCEEIDEWKSLKAFAKDYTETDIKSFGCIKLLSTGNVLEDFQDFSNDCIRIIIQPLLATTAGSSWKDIIQVTPGPDEIFENFLKSNHGQFLKTYIKNNDSLPSYNSETLLKISVSINFKGD